MSGSDSAQSLLGKKFKAAKSSWLADAADVFVLLCSFLLTTASIVLIALIFHAVANFEWDPVPIGVLSILQRAISALSLTVASAIILVAGKRYVLYKLARGGIRSRRVAIYSNPSIGNLAHYLACNGFEIPLLALSAVWGLGLATGLTVNDAWKMVPDVQSIEFAAPVGPLDAPVPAGSIFAPASGQLSYVMASVCSGVAGVTGVINFTSGGQLTSGGPMGALVYPPPPSYIPNSAFSLFTTLNGFNISMETLSSVPQTAQSLICVDSTRDGFSAGQLWYEDGDNQTLSIIGTLPFGSSLYRFYASAIVLGGTLKSTGNATEFTPNGTTWPNVMSNNLWAQDIARLICNSTSPAVGNCGSAGASLVNFAYAINKGPWSLSIFTNDTQMAAGIVWSTVLGMAMGAYSSASWPFVGNLAPVSATRYDVLLFVPRYGVYVLIANVIVSAITLVVVVRLRMASRLGPDFLNATRLLLDPFKNPELFNVSLDNTVNALADPYMLVRENSEFVLAETLEKRT